MPLLFFNNNNNNNKKHQQKCEYHINILDSLHQTLKVKHIFSDKQNFIIQNEYMIK
jgi:hypothetical protein